MLKTITAGLLALLAWTTTPASAASLKYKACDDGKAGCYVITIAGEITRDDGKDLADFVASKPVTSAVLWLNSPGGIFEDGMGIARLVRQRNFDTYVGDGGTCTSMCAIIWLAGNIRYYTGKAQIGFHSMSSWPVDKQGNRIRNGKVTSYNGGNALVGAFFSKLGLSDKAIEALTDAEYSSMFYLNTKNIEELGIAAKRWTPPSS